jgi:uncharacterized protein YjbJ (UPF0337 family)
MGSRIDEMTGKAKETVGDLTGNEQMEREGEAQADRAKLEREVEGTVDQTVGGIQEKVGDITDDAETELEGKARQLEGDIKRAG